MHKFFAFLLSLFFLYNCFSQNKKIALQNVLNSNEAYLYSQVFFMDSMRKLQKTDSLLHALPYPEVFTQIGWFYYFQKDYLKSIEIANNGLELKKIKKDQMQALHVLLGESAVKLGWYQRAIDYFGIAVVYKYPYHLLYAKFADLYWMLDNKDKALLYLKAAELININPIVVQRIGKYVFEAEGNYNDALKCYKSTDKAFFESVADYKKDMLRMYDKIKLYSFSNSIEQIALEQFPYNKNLLNEILILKEKNKDYTNFYEILYKYRKSYPHTAAEWNLIGNYYDNIGMIDSAMYFYKISIETDTNELHAYGNLGLVCTRFNFTDIAINYINTAIRNNPSHMNNYHRLVLAYLYGGDFKNAHKYLMKYEYKFKNDNNYLTLGFVSLSCGYYEDAIDYLQHYIKSNKNDDRAYNNLSWAYYHLEKYDSAQYYMDKVFSITQNNSYAYHHRAALNLKLGKLDNICSDLAKAVEYEYNNPYDKDLKQWAEKNCPTSLDLNKKIYLTGYKNNFKQYKNQKFLASEDSSLRENALKVLSISNIYEKFEKPLIDSENTILNFPNFPNFFSRVNFFKKQYLVQFTYYIDEPLEIVINNSKGEVVFQSETKYIFYKTLNLPVDSYVVRVKQAANIVAAYQFDMK